MLAFVCALGRSSFVMQRYLKSVHVSDVRSCPLSVPLLLPGSVVLLHPHSGRTPAVDLYEQCYTALREVCRA